MRCPSVVLTSRERTRDGLDRSFGSGSIRLTSQIETVRKRVKLDGCIVDFTLSKMFYLLTHDPSGRLRCMVINQGFNVIYTHQTSGVHKLLIRPIGVTKREVLRNFDTLKLKRSNPKNKT